MKLFTPKDINSQSTYIPSEMSVQENTEAVKSKNATAYQKFREKYVDTLTPEQKKERNLKLAAAAKKNYQKKLDNETPEQTAERRARLAKAARLKRGNLSLAERRARETPEETERRLRQLECMRNDRQKKRQQEIELRPPEMDKAQRDASRRLKKMEYLKKYYRERKVTLPAEEIEAQRLKSREQMRIVRQRIRENETPEQAIERRAKKARQRKGDQNKSKRHYQKWKVTVSAEQIEAQRLKSREQRRITRQRIRETETPEHRRARKAGQRKGAQKAKTNADGSCSSSSFTDSEDCSSRSISEESTSRPSIDDNGTGEEKSQPNFERDNIKSEKKDTLLQANWPESEKHLEYLASICEMLRTSKMDKSEIAVAKKLIDEIMLNLSMGKYNLLNCDESIMEQTVLVKEEIEL